MLKIGGAQQLWAMKRVKILGTFGSFLPPKIGGARAPLAPQVPTVLAIYGSKKPYCPIATLYSLASKNTKDAKMS